MTGSAAADAAPTDAAAAHARSQWPRFAAFVDRVAEPVFVLLAVALTIALSGRGGPKLSPDSMQYLSVAEHLRTGHGFTTYDMRALQVFPPAYPMLLAGLSFLVGGHLLGVAQVAGVVLAAISASLGWRLSRLHLGPFGAAVLAGGWALGMGGVTASSPWAWADPLLITSMLGLLYGLERTVEGERAPWRWLLLAGGCGSIAALSSYAGWQMAGAGALVLLAVGPAALRERIRRLFVYGVVVAVPTLAWVARNLAGSGNPAGPRVPSDVTFSGMLNTVGQLTTGVFFPGIAGGPGRILLFVLLVLAVPLVLVTVVGRLRADAKPDGERSAVALVVFGGVSYLLLVGSSLWVWVSMDARVYSRVAFPLALALAVAVRRTVGPRWRTLVAKLPSLGMLTAAGVVCVWLLADFHGMWIAGSAPRRDYSTVAWHDRVAAVDRVLPPGADVWSNQPDVVWFYTRRTVKLLPQQRVLFDPRTPAEQLAAFREEVAETPQGIYVVTFVGAGLSTYLPAEGVLFPRVEYLHGLRHQVVASGRDWAVEHVTSPGP